MYATPSIFAYPAAKDNTPLYLKDSEGAPIALGSIKLTEGWQTFREAGTDREVRVRRADCGAGCRCAAEYRIGESDE